MGLLNTLQERVLCGRESGVFGCGGFEDGMDAERNNNDDDVEEEGKVGETKESSGGGRFSSERMSMTREFFDAIEGRYTIAEFHHQTSKFHHQNTDLFI